MRILCVEDDHLVRAITCDMLRDLGHDVEDVAGCSEAIEHIEESGADLDLLVTDIQLDGPEGPKIAAIARRKKPGLPVIYFTGYNGLQHEREPRSELLRKPCTLGAWEGAISRVCAAA